MQERPATEIVDLIPYGHVLARTVESVGLFRGDLTWPGSLTADEILGFALGVYGACTLTPETIADQRTLLGEARDTHRVDDPETRAFLDALLILLDGRPSDLPEDNRYRPFLVTRDRITAFRTSGEEAP
ncbi:hypothetical protein [Streptomyces sp. HUAS ZL42]|uniref:hypothetical protein n=1 Tax=Streptomyces sp. HUAS ZL42 TaxID=3231715 RepID=UPI00345EDA18